MSRPVGSKNKPKVLVTGTDPATTVDYKKLYETLKKEDEDTRKALAELEVKYQELEKKYKATRKLLGEADAKVIAKK